MEFRSDSEGLAPGYGEATDLTIYRAIQEGVTNALRHAQATVISIALREVVGERGSSLVLAVTDNGPGISPSASSGFGLRAMRERVRTQGGKFSIEGSGGGGTRIEVTIPVLQQHGQAGSSSDLREPPS